MADQGPPAVRPPQRGGGIFIALGLVGGAIAGVVVGQPSLGLIGGLCVGVLAAIGLALRDRR